MRMLGEMALAAPQAGSFIGHVRRGLGGRAAYVAGWLYWLFWAVVVAAEAIGGSAIVSAWVPLPRGRRRRGAGAGHGRDQPGVRAQLRRVRVLVLQRQGAGDRRLLRAVPRRPRRSVRSAPGGPRPAMAGRLPAARGGRGAGDHPDRGVPVHRSRDRHRRGGGIRRPRPERRPCHQHRGGPGAAVLRELDPADPVRGAVAPAGAGALAVRGGDAAPGASRGRRRRWRSWCWWRCCPA